MHESTPKKRLLQLERMKSCIAEMLESFMNLPFDPDDDDILAFSQKILSPSDSLFSEARALSEEMDPAEDISLPIEQLFSSLD